MFRVLIIFAFALTLQGADPGAEIRKLLHDQELAWNRGDIPGFMSGYNNSPETTFVGTEISKGFQAVLDRYIAKYPSKEKMGTLNFSGIEVRMLGADYASVLGRYHLTRTKEAGGDRAVFLRCYFTAPRQAGK
jgi:hypothetical protein